MKRNLFFTLFFSLFFLAACKSKGQGESNLKRNVKEDAPSSIEEKLDAANAASLTEENLSDELLPVLEKEISEIQDINPLENLNLEYFESCAFNPFEKRQKENSFIDESGLGTINYYPDFYPLGWSKDGDFAYCIKQFVDGAGETRISFVIQDTVSDKILFRLDDTVCNLMSLFFSNYFDQIKAAILEKEIILQKSEYICDASQNEITYLVHAMNEKVDEYGMKKIDYFVQAQKGTGSKILMTKNDVLANSVFVCGAFKSPYENRQALLLAEVDLGFEGCDINYIISGCHTKIGF